ncbi:TetR/AcrR family transcriptional regulator [Thalassotalea euphylliae]|uniref:TetR/AcrR family transcriptional regulator n=2 Tax=Thalassotalea euphylliae TaxID=1655234 RepID=A0A3E0U0S3_9GAMM|nr:TetR/AcrR family transcriptional regulator [Thalassotalea euphylliae]
MGGIMRSSVCEGQYFCLITHKIEQRFEAFTLISLLRDKLIGFDDDSLARLSLIVTLHCKVNLLMRTSHSAIASSVKPTDEVKSMQQDSIIEAKQVRSQQTQEKLLNALNNCLKEDFFEHISIAQITEQAGVSVGTFYRRFKNKEALLPYLYQDFGTQQRAWVLSLTTVKQESLAQQVQYIIDNCCEFLSSNAGVLRTLHLNSRLYPEILPTSQLSERSQEYREIAAMLIQHSTEINHPQPSMACDMATFMMINGLIEKILYQDLTPAIASPLAMAEHCKQLGAMIVGYLTAKPE